MSKKDILYGSLSVNKTSQHVERLLFFDRPICPPDEVLPAGTICHLLKFYNSNYIPGGGQERKERGENEEQRKRATIASLRIDPPVQNLVLRESLHQLDRPLRPAALHPLCVKIVTQNQRERHQVRTPQAHFLGDFRRLETVHHRLPQVDGQLLHDGFGAVQKSIAVRSHAGVRVSGGVQLGAQRLRLGAGEDDREAHQP